MLLGGCGVDVFEQFSKLRLSPRCQDQNGSMNDGAPSQFSVTSRCVGRDTVRLRSLSVYFSRFKQTRDVKDFLLQRASLPTLTFVVKEYVALHHEVC